MEQFQKNPSLDEARKNALAALAADAGKDITSNGCIPAAASCTGKIIAKSSFVLCGIIEADKIFAGRNVRVKWKFREGQHVKRGSVVAVLPGNCRSILACERTALNYLMLLSGVASKSAAAAKKYGKGKIAATRKTIPLLSPSQKRAVKVGGCLTHRMDLSDGILVKDNHIAAIMRQNGVGRTAAVEMAVRSFPRSSFVEVEVSSLFEAVAAVKAGAKAILVDNVKPPALRKIVSAVRKINRRTIIEASGGITLKNAGAYLKAGADFVSTSELTMKTEPANLSLEIDVG